jgi:hypothetical protein
MEPVEDDGLHSYNEFECRPVLHGNLRLWHENFYYTYDFDDDHRLVGSQSPIDGDF